MKPFQSALIFSLVLSVKIGLAGTSGYSNVGSAITPSSGSSTNGGGAGVSTSGTIPFTIQSVGSAQSAAPVFTGIPFPPHTLTDPNQIDLVINGQSVPRQVKTLCTYPDGSQRVVLLGFNATLTAGQTISAQIRYGQGSGTAIGTAITWTRNTQVIAMCSPQWYGDSGVFGLPFISAANNTISPSFETGWMNNFFAACNPPVPNGDQEDDPSYYDHVHALYMLLLSQGGPSNALQRISEEIHTYRDTNLTQSGFCQGAWNSLGAATCDTSYYPYYPMQDLPLRHSYALGLLEDYYFSGDPQSLTVATWIGQRLLDTEHVRRGQSIRGWSGWINWGGNPTENVDIRIPGWALISLCELYNATLNTAYLTAANAIGNEMVSYQNAMATTYPNQGGVTGQTGGFVQGAWADPSETTCGPGVGSPFMTTIACRGLAALYWINGNTAIRDCIVNAANWIANTAYSPSDNAYYYLSLPRLTCSSITFGTTPDITGMFYHVLGFAWQVTGNSLYLNQAKLILSNQQWSTDVTGAKQFNENSAWSGQGLYLLQKARGSALMTSQ